MANMYKMKLDSRFEMSNDELSNAIEATSGLYKRTASGSRLETMYLDHLRELLAVQLFRARALALDDADG